MQRLEHGYFVTLFGEVARACKSRGAASDNGYFYAVALRLVRLFFAMLVVIVRDEPFQSADTYRLAFDAANTMFFTLSFLRADSAAHRGERRGFCDYFVCALVILFANLGDKFRNTDHNGATVYARFVFAVKASFRFRKSLFFGISQSDFFEVFISFFRALNGHRIFC